MNEEVIRKVSDKINLKDYRCWCGGATQVNDDIYFAVLYA